MYVITTDIPGDAKVTTQTFERAVKIISEGVQGCKDFDHSPPTFTITSDKWEHIKMEAYVDKASGFLVYVPVTQERV